MSALLRPIAMARSLILPLFIFACLLLAPIARISADGDEQDVGNVVDGIIVEGGDDEVGLVGEGVQDIFDVDLKPASGVDTVFYFPKNLNKVIPVGEQSEILVGVGNHGDLPLTVHSIRASLHLPFDYRLYVQNFTLLEFVNATVPPMIQASFPYSFTVSKYLQPGEFALVASIFYEVDGQPHQSVFYNGTVEVVEASGFLSGETLFLITLGLGLLGLFGMWVYGQFQRLSKKTRRVKKVDTGARSTELGNNEWLQGTAFTQKLSRSIAQPTKSKKKK